MPVAIARTQGPFQRVAATSQPFTVTATVSGERLVAVITLKTGATQSVSGVSGGGGTWALVGTAGLVSGSNTRIEIWENRTTNASTTTITVTPSASLAVSLDLYEITGSDLAVASTGTSGGDATSDTAWNGGTLTPASGNWLLIAGVSPNATASRTISAVTAGWATARSIAASTTLHQIVTSSRIVAANGSTAYPITFTASAAQTNGFSTVQVPEASASTPKSAADSNLITGAETATSANTSTTADANLVTGAETATSANMGTVADTSLVAGAESATITITTTLSASDANLITGADTADVVQQTAVSATDAGLITGTDAASISEQSTRSAADSSLITGTDSAAILEQTAKASTDAGTVTGSDTATALTDSIATDTTVITGTDGITLAVAGLTSDTGVLTGTETVSVVVTMVVNDAGTLATIDAATTSAAILATDTTLITGVDMASTNVIGDVSPPGIAQRIAVPMPLSLSRGAGASLEAARLPQDVPIGTTRAATPVPVSTIRTAVAMPLAATREV